MSHRLSQNARHTNDLLEELERDKELEVLREYLTRFDLFPQRPRSASKSSRSSGIFGRHATKEDLVRTLYRHINTKVIPQENRGENNASTVGPPAGDNSAQYVGGGVVPMAPTAPARKASSMAAVESPRSKSILVHVNRAHGPKKEHIFSEYSGDLFSQRGGYEDGMIYLSRFQKPGLAVDGALNKSSDNTHDLNQDEDEEDMHLKSQDELDLANTMSREVRLKQECAFSIYHFTTRRGHEKQMVSEGCMQAISRLSVFDDIEVKKFRAAAILNLTWEASLCLKVIEEGVLLALLELAKAQHEEI